MILKLEEVAVVQRRRKDLGDIGALAESIKLNGQITAGVVRPATEGDRADDVDLTVTPWVLVAGGRRYAALMSLGYDKFRADSLGDLSPLQRKIIELEENLNRKDLAWDEEVQLREEIHNLRQSEHASTGSDRPWSMHDTAQELGMTKGNLSKDLKLAAALKENPALKSAPTKQSAMRLLAYDEAIKGRIASVDGASLLKTKEKLFTEDMRDFVRFLPDNSVDLCFTDFPFGIDYNFEAQDRNKYVDSQSSLLDLLSDVIPEIIRVTKPTGWLALMMGSTNYGALKDLVETCCAEHYDYFDGWWEQDEVGVWSYKQKARCLAFQNAPDLTCRHLEVEDPEWLWFRPNSRNPSMHAELHAQNQYEKICVVNMGSAVLTKKNEGNVLVHDAVYEDRIHEMQRPHNLCLDIVSRFTLGGERVLDLCFGSGSALAAAAELQRDFLGCDINPKNLVPALAWVAEHLK